MKTKKLDGVIFGFALFAMFFGSGNVIFPPFLGLQCGPEWLGGIISYMISDICVAMLIFISIVRIDGNVNSITNRLGKVPGRLLIAVATICIGPLFCIPRAAATSFDMLVTPVTGLSGKVALAVFVVIFFVITYALCAKPNNVCDVIGKFLTPALIIFIAIMVVKGVVTPIAPYADSPMVENVIKNGVEAGYQSMECFGGLPLVPVLMAGILAKGYTKKEEQIKIMTPTVLVCLLCLFAASVGMAYLGATVSTLYDDGISQATLVINIANHLFGGAGGMILGVLASLACLTTAVGLVSGTAKYFSELYPRLSYGKLIVVICIMDVLISLMGLKNIIAFALPILTLLYPLMVLMIVMSLFTGKIKSDGTFIGAAVMTLLVSALSMLSSFEMAPAFVQYIPFFKEGFGWVIPAIVGGIVGSFAGKSVVNKEEKGNEV